MESKKIEGKFWFTILSKLPSYFSLGASCAHQV